MTGRPTLYCAEQADEIIARLENGETLRAICREEGQPARKTFMQWVLDDRDGLSARYARAREQGYDEMAEDMLDISDGGDDDVQRSRLRVDARKWFLSKMRPDRYGTKITVETPEAPKTREALLAEIEAAKKDAGIE